MRVWQTYLVVLFSALLLFPLLEKAQHELGHLNEDACSTNTLHYCAQEHGCEVCDYIFSPSLQPASELAAGPLPTHSTPTVISFLTRPLLAFTASAFLRGPPCA